MEEIRITKDIPLRADKNCISTSMMDENFLPVKRHERALCAHNATMARNLMHLLMSDVALSQEDKDGDLTETIPAIITLAKHGFDNLGLKPEAKKELLGKLIDKIKAQNLDIPEEHEAFLNPDLVMLIKTDEIDIAYIVTDKKVKRTNFSHKAKTAIPNP